MGRKFLTQIYENEDYSSAQPGVQLGQSVLVWGANALFLKIGAVLQSSVREEPIFSFSEEDLMDGEEP